MSDITADDLKAATAGLETLKRLSSQGAQSERMLDVLAGIESGLIDLVEAIASQGDKGALVKAVQAMAPGKVEPAKQWKSLRVTAHKNGLTGAVESWQIDRND